MQLPVSMSGKALKRVTQKGRVGLTRGNRAYTSPFPVGIVRTWLDNHSALSHRQKICHVLAVLK